MTYCRSSNLFRISNAAPRAVKFFQVKEIIGVMVGKMGEAHVPHLFVIVLAVEAEETWMFPLPFLLRCFSADREFFIFFWRAQDRYP